MFFMKNIQFLNNNVKITLNPTIYPKDKIERACRDFKDIFEFQIKDNENELEILLKLKKDDLEIKKTFFEFMNYLLGLLKLDGI